MFRLSTRAVSHDAAVPDVNPLNVWIFNAKLYRWSLNGASPRSPEFPEDQVGIFENLLSILPKVTKPFLSEKTDFLPTFLLKNDFFLKKIFFFY